MSEEVFEFRKAVRHRVPQLLALYGVQFSGKTFSALMLAAGLVKPGGKIGFIDTENGRGSAFADDPDVMREIPQGYTIAEIHPPFHPRRYIECIRQFERAGFDLLIIDSASHAWEGEGGAQDIKEKEKGWAGAKLWSKRLKFALIYSQMDIIVCLRAQEKTKIVGSGRDQQYIPLGILPICEKSLPFDLGTSIRIDGSVDGKPATHFANPDKWPKGMSWLFGKWEPQLLTPAIGKRIREWNDGGAKQEESDRLRQQARHAAEIGLAEYQSFFGGLSPGQKKVIIDTDHAANKAKAQEADAEQATAYKEEFGLLRSSVGDDAFFKVLGNNGLEKIEDASAAEREKVLAELARISA